MDALDKTGDRWKDLLPLGVVGEGFSWEIEQIVRYDLQSRVIIVPLPLTKG